MRTAKETIFSDRGSLILSPKVGLHENVGVLDFESLYPYIIIKHNISYETATPNHIRSERKGFLSHLTEEYLERRLNFKHFRDEVPRESKEWLWCEQRQGALKDILVWTYGYSGCSTNRFNSVVCYEEVNRLARDTLVKAMNVAMAEGCEVIYADSDSLFIKREGARRDDLESLGTRISGITGLSHLPKGV